MGIIRKLLSIPAAGLSWYFGLRLFFIWSGAQSILGNPTHQSGKFMDAFIKEPFPRMAADAWLPFKGMVLCGAVAALVFIFLNDKLQGRWLKKDYNLD